MKYAITAFVPSALLPITIPLPGYVVEEMSLKRDTGFIIYLRLVKNFGFVIFYYNFIFTEKRNSLGKNFPFSLFHNSFL